MLKNFFVIVVVSLLTSFAWSAHLMSNQFRRRVDRSLDTIWAIAERSELSNTLSTSLLDLGQKEAVVMARARQLARRHSRSVPPPCHFKICNMGRKRSTRFIHNLHYIEG